jgi:DNA polymerase-3 subunit gamma/tau
MADGYQVIARRWRPKNFNELVGQEHIVRTLKNAIEHNRIAHAYLFVGPRGTGKTSTARLFAKSLNCEGGPSITPPEDSPICKAIMQGTCMDVIEIDGASNNSVDQVRDLREECQYAPAQCTYKIYIIDEVHMLSTAAFNALLKTLEEPPAHVKFIFATTESHKVLPTIVSRCQRFEFRPISEKVIAEKLGHIAQTEGITISPEALSSIARLANGGMRDAQSILDQMISFCGTTIEESDMLDVYGLASLAQIQSLGKALAMADYPSLIRTADALAKEGRDLYRVLLDLEAWVREALLDSIAHGGQSSLLGHPLSTESLMRMLESLHSGESRVTTGLSEKVSFEVVLLKALEESRARAIDSLIKELTGLVDQLPESEAGKKKISPRPPVVALNPEEESAPPEPFFEKVLPIPETETQTGTPQPSLAEVIARVPESLRNTLEERFRARFTGVHPIDEEKLIR